MNRKQHRSRCDFITQREGVGGKGCILLTALFFEMFSCCVFRSLSIVEQGIPCSGIRGTLHMSVAWRLRSGRPASKAGHWVGQFHGSLRGSSVQLLRPSPRCSREAGAPRSVSSCFYTVTNVDFYADAFECFSSLHTLRQPTAFRDNDLHIRLPSQLQSLVVSRLVSGPRR